MDEEQQRLKDAMAEIDAIVERENLVGYVVIQSQTRAEFLLSLTRNWTCLSHDPETAELRIKSTDLPKEDKKEILGNSVGTLMTLSHMLKEHGMLLDALNLRIGESVEVSHMLRELPDEKDDLSG